MPTIFNSKDSVFFVGGTGTKAGIANPGGCTLTWFNASFTALTDIVGVNGAALIAVVDGEPEPDNKTMTKAGECGSAEAGMVAYLSGTNVVNGRYEVISTTANTIVFPDNTFAVGGGWVDDLVCNVGGAFDTLQNACDDTDADAGTPHNVNILDNKGKTYAGAGDHIDVDTGFGNDISDTWKTIIGVDDHGAELAEGSYVIFDVNGQACHGFTFDASNVRLKHICAKDTDALHDGFHLAPPAALRYGINLEYCSSTGCRHGIYLVSVTVQRRVTVRGGYYKSAIDAAIKSSILYGFEMLGVTVERSNAGPVVLFDGFSQAIIDGCLFKGNGVATYAIQQGTLVAFLKIRDCVFYDVLSGFHFIDASRLVQYNNICIVHAKATGKFITGTGSIDYSDYCCLWAMDGAPVAADRWGGTGLPPNSIEADPLFVNAPANDFTLKTNSPCFKKGMKTLVG